MEGRLPQVDKLLRHPKVEEEQASWRREILAELCRETLAELRSQKAESTPSLDEVAQMVVDRAVRLRQPGLQKVINGTGVVLNTNLGRAPLASQLIGGLAEIACGYSNLELDLETGKRGKRSERVKTLLRLLTGCESALVVNNNAAAVVLAVNCFARDREVIVSRGELIEIGGSFRLPDVIESAGARLKEVGTTNRTRRSDYERAIGAGTGLLMRCHRSNFKVTGFTEDTTLTELVDVSNRSGVPFLEDLGSGVLVDLKGIGLTEPTVAEVVKSGCGLVSFSGDKLLGGPQAGMIVGKKELIDRLARHPLYRALRVDKITNALLEQTLLLYSGANAFEKVPALKMMAATEESIKSRVDVFVSRAVSQLKILRCKAMPCSSAIGGGSLPGEEKLSWCVVLDWGQKKANALAALLRAAPVPVVAIVQNDELRIDFRTVFECDEESMLAYLIELDQRLVASGAITSV
ncbi:MAG: L-seryl-tRNA(Sec) selenium transferase [Candidatus Obscuribacterales bacterium]|nr:L-seryl-tRNA(Sec) selenium transferase [Candidatus Obscuribacterales bacterium]